ncbi:hypothetical protein CEXT_369511 [Caerostris extrusa]|uniref:Uncharacterized protein n=1 Tax=Caerostris extrusa TaxID=172846 RepID=A0AAV4SV29_CAEEX|nr:hypothetical protein CEXT_369511 [Caerostris extrusa]
MAQKGISIEQNFHAEEQLQNIDQKLPNSNWMSLVAGMQASSFPKIIKWDDWGCSGTVVVLRASRLPERDRKFFERRIVKQRVTVV